MERHIYIYKISFCTSHGAHSHHLASCLHLDPIKFSILTSHLIPSSSLQTFFYFLFSLEITTDNFDQAQYSPPSSTTPVIAFCLKMHFFPILTRLSVSLSLLSLVPVVHSHAVASDTRRWQPDSMWVRNNTLEGCRTNRDCRKDLRCKSLRSGQLSPTSCPATSKIPCYCYPRRPVQCSGRPEERRCPIGETCAQSLGNNVFCLGCNALVDLAPQYSPVNKGDCNVSVPTNSPAPAPYVPARTADLCSVVSPCAKDLRCADSSNGLECGRFSTRCHCVAKKGGPNSCKSSNECPHSDVCAFHTIEGAKVCVSCDAARSFVFYNLVLHDDPKCKPSSNALQRSVPHFREASDGYTLDTCTDAVHCRDQLDCREFGRSKRCSKKSFFCVCQEPDNALHPCETSTDCAIRRVGEVCASGNALPSDRSNVCVSHIYKQENFPNDIFVKEPLPGYGSNVTGEACLGELDCVENLACTHPSDDFGGCAGRFGCTCQPIRLHVCEGDADCPPREVCVNVRSAKSKNFCKAESAVDHVLEYIVSNDDSDGYFVKRRKNSTWLGELCRDSHDCVNDRRFDRKCLHFLERYGECDGDRQACICKAVFPTAGNKHIHRSKIANCGKKSECGAGEQCVQFKDTVAQSRKPGFCLAKTIASNSELTYLE